MTRTLLGVALLCCACDPIISVSSTLSDDGEQFAYAEEKTSAAERDWSLSFLVDSSETGGVPTLVLAQVPGRMGRVWLPNIGRFYFLRSRGTLVATIESEVDHSFEVAAIALDGARTSLAQSRCPLAAIPSYEGATIAVFSPDGLEPGGGCSIEPTVGRISFVDLDTATSMSSLTLPLRVVTEAAWTPDGRFHVRGIGNDRTETMFEIDSSVGVATVEELRCIAPESASSQLRIGWSEKEVEILSAEQVSLDQCGA